MNLRFFDSWGEVPPGNAFAYGRTADRGDNVAKIVVVGSFNMDLVLRTPVILVAGAWGFKL